MSANKPVGPQKLLALTPPLLIVPVEKLPPWPKTRVAVCDGKLADLDRREVERLSRTLQEVPLFAVPRLRKDVHDLSGLWQIDEYLGGE